MKNKVILEPGATSQQIKTDEDKLFAQEGYKFENPSFEIYHKEKSGEWHAVHSTWSFIRPMEMDFSSAK